MQLNVTETDKYQAHRKAMLFFAEFYEIEKAELITNVELYEEIQLLKSPAVKELNEFFIAYEKWFSYYQSLKKDFDTELQVRAEQCVYPTVDHSERLKNLKNDRDLTFDTLISKLIQLFDEKHSN